MLLLLVALAVRIGVILATPHLSLASDPADYARHGTSIATGHGFPASGVAKIGGPTAIRPPGFPFLLGAIFKLTGNSVTAARVAVAFVGTGILALLALISLEFWSAAVALTVVGLGTVFPPLIIDGVTLLSEPLFVFLELAALAAILRWRATGPLPWLVGAGALGGLALLTRSNGGLLLLPLVFAARRQGSWRQLRSYGAPAALVISAILVVAPWTIRNADQFHSFIPVTTQDGYTLAGTYNATSRAHDGVWITANADPAVARLLASSRQLDERRVNTRLRGAARRFAIDHPAYVAKVALLNTLRLFNLGGGAYERAVAGGDYGLGPNWALLMTVGLFPFLVLALLGLATRAFRRAPVWFWSVPLLMLAPVLVLATNRTRAPIDPFLLLLGAFGVIGIWTRLTGERSRHIHRKTLGVRPP